MRKLPEEINHFLPFGEMLRGFIEQSVIPRSDLSNLLRARGIFTESDEKEATIPILCSTILSPDEVDILRNCYRNKEDSPKTITQTIPWRGNATLIDSMPLDILDNYNNELEFSNYKLVTTPDFISVGNNPDHVKLDFEIERTDTSKSWSESTNQFHGTVELKRISDVDSVKLAITYTAKETLFVARKTSDRLVAHLKATGHLAENDAPRRILFSSFSNAERVNFLLQLTVHSSSNVLKFLDLVKLGVSPDPTLGELPDSLSWSERRVSDLRCKGKSLHTTAFVEDDASHPFIMLHGVDSSFEFDVRGAIGDCIAVFSFPRFESHGDRNSELVVKVQDIRITSGNARPRALETTLLEELQDLAVRVSLRSQP